MACIAQGSAQPPSTAAAVLTAADAFARTELAPNRIAIERDGVSQAIIDRLRAIGALRVGAATRHGGIPATPAEQRALHEIIAWGSLDVWLVWGQHSGAISRTAAVVGDSIVLHPLIAQLLAGRILGGAALSDVRHYPHRHIAAHRDGDGWRLTGTISWVSGWGLNRALLTAAVDADLDQVVVALVPAEAASDAEALGVAAVGGSRTWRVHLRDVLVEDALVLEVLPRQRFAVLDADGAIDAKAHLFGLARAITDLLHETPAATELADAVATRFDVLRRQAYALLDQAHASRLAADAEQAATLTARRLQVRGEASSLLAEAARALVIAHSGRAISATDEAQLLARDALFLQVQAQTRQVREAQFDDIADRLSTGAEAVTR